MVTHTRECVGLVKMIIARVEMRDYLGAGQEINMGECNKNVDI